MRITVETRWSTIDLDATRGGGPAAATFRELELSVELDGYIGHEATAP